MVLVDQYLQPSPNGFHRRMFLPEADRACLRPGKPDAAFRVDASLLSTSLRTQALHESYYDQAAVQRVVP